MRQFKFRAWDKTARTFYFASLSDNGWAHQDTDLEGHELSEWQQYTGLKDKNGVDIYEGDVILTADDLRKQVVGNWKPKMRVVEWTDNKEYKTGFNLGRAQHGKCEVIGNVYENSELLKEGV